MVARDEVPALHLSAVDMTLEELSAVRGALANPVAFGVFRVDAPPPVVAQLARRRLAVRDDVHGGYVLTPRGRRQVRWYAEDLAAWWTKQGGRTTTVNAVYKAVHQNDERVVTKGPGAALIPEIAGREPRRAGSGTSMAPYWSPDIAREFIRPGRGRRTDTVAGASR